MANALLSELAAYIPRDRVYSILQPDASLAEDGVALIADISGFTRLTEALTHGLSPDQGAEELTRALDTVFTPLIGEVHRFRGSVIKFGGDALIVWFGREKWVRRTAVIHRALTAAWSMQALMQQHGQVPTPIGPVTLRMKIGLTYGPVQRFNLGLPEIGLEDVLAGATLDRMAANEHLAQPGDIMLDRDTLAFIEDRVRTAGWRGDVALLGGLTRRARPKPWPRLPWETANTATLMQRLSTYVPQPIVETLQTGRIQVAELKPVVSLFVQFHGLDYDGDADIESKLQIYFRTAQRVVAQYNGRLNRLITGDKGSLLHIIFGAPRVVEEQEARAVGCALDLQATCGQLPFIHMQRIGMAAGRVFAGPVGAPQRHDYTTMGDTINLSARLMQNAADDQVLFDEGVRAGLGQSFAVTGLGAIQVKGKADPIAVFEAARAAAGRNRRAVTRLFGRGAETAVLQQHITHLEAGQGGVVQLIGEVGMGKTVLLENVQAQTEVRWRMQPDGGVWASGISLAYGNHISGYLFIELLRDLLNLAGGASAEATSQRLADFCELLFGAERVAATYPYLARFMGLPLAPDVAQRLESLAGESVRWQIFALVPEVLRLLSERFPLVLALDDWQWADPTSRQLVEALLPLTSTQPILILLAQRPEGELLDTAVPVTPITLEAIPEADAVELIQTLSPDLPPHLVHHLVEMAGGNPLFLAEMVRTLKLQGDVDWQAVDVELLALPTSVQGLLLAQLDRLAVEARHTLQLASVIGRTFLDRVLASLAQAQRQLSDLLGELEEQAYIQPAQPTELGEAHAFRHSLIQESAYSTLLYERRRAYHQQVAEALEQLFPEAIAEQAAFLAYHYEQAGALTQAIYYLNQTADQARLLYAHEEAEALYERILTLLAQQSPPDEEARARTYLKLAQVYANRMDFTTAQTHYERAFAYFERQAGETAVTTPATATFRWGLLDQTSPMDPALVESGEVAEVVGNLFEGLVEIDNEWNVVPAAARRWQIENGGRRYRLELRPGLQWSDGTRLTAQDFVFAWRRNLAPATEAGLASELYVVAGAEAYHQGETEDPAQVAIRALDELTLEIELVTPTPYFPYLLADPITFPQPRHLVQRVGAAWVQPAYFVGNGPFVLRRGEGGRPLRLERNALYRGLQRGNIQTVLLPPVAPDLAHYEQDAVDWCRVDDRADIPRRYPAEAHLVQRLATFVLVFACQQRPFSQTVVRQAFAASIDKVDLVRQVWSGVQRPASGGFIPPGMSGHSPEIGWPFDPARARALLAQADWPAPERAERPLTLAAFPGFGTVPQYLQAAWQQHLGVSVQILPDTSVNEALDGLAQGSVQMVLLGMSVDRPDPDILRVLAHSESALNYWGWHNDTFDQLVDRALQTQTPSERLALYHEADALLVRQETAVVPLYHLQAHGLLRRGFQLEGAERIVRDGAMKFKNVIAAG